MHTFWRWAAAATVVLAACGGNVVVDGVTGPATSTSTGTGNQPINQDTNGTGYGGYTVTGTGYGGYTVTGPGYGGYPDTGTGYGGDYASSTSGGDGDGGDVVFDGSLGCTPGCAQTLVNGGTGVCSGSPALARMDLLGCACSPDACQVSCGFNICVYEAVTATCMQCLQTNCAAQLSTCEEN